MKTCFILVDYENVQPERIPGCVSSSAEIRIFLGEHQSKVPVEFANSLQRLGRKVEYIQIKGNGKNALDFHIAYWLGRLAEDSPESGFFVVSKDTGFDPLIQFIRSEGTFAKRITKLSQAHIPKGPTAQIRPEQRFQHAVDSLKKRGTSRPKKRQSLRNTLSQVFNNALRDEELDALLHSLETSRAVTVEGERVTYQLN